VWRLNHAEYDPVEAARAALNQAPCDVGTVEIWQRSRLFFGFSAAGHSRPRGGILHLTTTPSNVEDRSDSIKRWAGILGRLRGNVMNVAIMDRGGCRNWEVEALHLAKLLKRG
jgi:hypothetical protein